MLMVFIMSILNSLERLDEVKLFFKKIIQVNMAR